MSLPASPRRPDDVLAELRALRAGDAPTRGSRVLAYVYDAGRPEIDEVALGAHALAYEVNGLDPTVFPSVARLERDVVAAAAALLGGPAHTTGSVTSGGTESILLAVKAARDHARRTRKLTGRLTVVLPASAHPAFRKAAHYLDLEVVTTPLDPATLAADPAALAAAIDPDRTALVVASAPSYPHGVIDPVPAIAGAAAAAGVPCHVDSCIGGWILPWWRRLGVDLPPFDLSVPGVSSLSVDLHKYAHVPKGVSVLLFADPQLRRGAVYATAAWPGYPVVNTTAQSTKSAGPLAAAWAVLQTLGEQGYLELAQAALEATVRLRAGIAAIEGLRLVGDAHASLIAFTADEADAASPDVLVVADEMAARGWYTQPQPAFAGQGLQLPAAVHLTVTAATAPVVDALLADLSAAVEAARLVPSPQPDPGLVALAADLDPDALGPEQVAAILGGLGLAGDDGAVRLPERMAPVYALMGALPRPLTERLLTEVLLAVLD